MQKSFFISSLQDLQTIKRIYYLVKLMKLREKFRIMATVGGRHFKTFTSIPILLSFDKFMLMHVSFCDNWSFADSLLKTDNNEWDVLVVEVE